MEEMIQAIMLLYTKNLIQQNSTIFSHEAVNILLNLKIYLLQHQPVEQPISWLHISKLREVRIRQKVLVDLHLFLVLMLIRHQQLLGSITTEPHILLRLILPTNIVSTDEQTNTIPMKWYTILRLIRLICL